MATLEVECAACGGTGWRSSAEGKGPVVPCECRERNRAAKALEIAGIPAKYHACSFGNFDAHWEGSGRNETL